MAETAELILRLRAEQFEKGLSQVRRSTKKTEDFLTGLKGNVVAVNQAFDLAARGFRLASRAISAATLPIKTAVQDATDFQTAFTGVVKVLDATEEELRGVRRTFIDLSKEIPVTAKELAGIGEAAGRLGIPIANIEKFTETIARLGVTTELSAEEAATSLARFANITRLPLKSIDRLGAAIVDLGNNFATSEPEIVALSTRLAAAGSIAGLSAEDILAFGAAISSVGVEAEAGGTAFSKVFTRIGDAAAEGGEKLETFAKVAGVTAEEFRRQFGEDPAAAIDLFVTGLGRIAEEAGTVTPVLDALNLENERTRRALLSVAKAGDVLNRSLARSQAAFIENEALTKESELRFRDFASRVQVLRNNIEAVSIQIGDKFLPILGEFSKVASEIISRVGKWVEANDRLVTGATLTIIGLLTDGFIILAKTIVISASVINDFRQGFAFLGEAGALILRGLAEAFKFVADLIADAAFSIIPAFRFAFNEARILFKKFQIGIIKEILENPIANRFFPEAALKGLQGRFAELKTEIRDVTAAQIKFFTPEEEKRLEKIKAETATITGFTKDLQDNAKLYTAEVEKTEAGFNKIRGEINALDGAIDGLIQKQIELNNTRSPIARDTPEPETVGPGVFGGGPPLAPGFEPGSSPFAQSTLLENSFLLEAKQENLLAQEIAENESFERRIETFGLFNASLIEAFQLTGNTLNDITLTFGNFLVGTFQNVEGAVVSAFDAMIFGGEKASVIFKNLGKTIIKELLAALVRIGIQSLLNNILQLGFAKSQIASGKATTYINAFASTAAIPIIGPALAPAVAEGASNFAAGRAGTILAGAANGADFVPNDQVAFIHRGERVVPAETNQDLTQFLDDGGSLGGGQNVNIMIDTFIGTEEFADELTSRISDAFEFRNVDQRLATDAGGF